MSGELPDPGAGRLVLLDRDGVLNEDADAYVKSVAEWRPLAGSLEAVARLCDAGFTVAVVTNQSGLARGLFSRATLEAIHAEMLRQVEAAGGRIAGLFVCPHGPDEGCRCRKPEPGLLLQAARTLGLPLERACFVGDKPEDVEAARRAGCEPILVRTGKGSAAVRDGCVPRAVAVFDDLAAAAEHLIRRAPGGGSATEPEAGA